MGGGRFSRRLIDCVSVMSEIGLVPLPEAVVLDIDWWVKALLVFKGKACLIIDPDWSFVAVHWLGKWFVCGVGEKCVVGSFEFVDIDLPELIIVSPFFHCIKLAVFM